MHIRDELITRLQSLGDERTPRQDALLRTCVQARALSRMHDRRARREHAQS